MRFARPAGRASCLARPAFFARANGPRSPPASPAALRSRRLNAAESSGLAPRRFRLGRLIGFAQAQQLFFPLLKRG